MHLNFINIVTDYLVKLYESFRLQQTTYGSRTFLKKLSEPRMSTSGQQQACYSTSVGIFSIFPSDCVPGLPLRAKMSGRASSTSPLPNAPKSDPKAPDLVPLELSRLLVELMVLVPELEKDEELMVLLESKLEKEGDPMPNSSNPPSNPPIPPPPPPPLRDVRDLSEEGEVPVKGCHDMEI